MLFVSVLVYVCTQALCTCNLCAIMLSAYHGIEHIYVQVTHFCANQVCTFIDPSVHVPFCWSVCVLALAEYARALKTVRVHKA